MSMSIEEQVLESEYQLMLDHLTLRSRGSGFLIEDIEQEFEHLLVYQGQDWVGRGEIKNAEIQGHVYAYQIFLKRWKEAHLNN
ncbi:MAG: hypothetical protein WCY74_04915 [Sphaerochaetaceae bacterium]|nr:hypothetical protein [Sphaerochaetaceae bacterium]MDX9939960.1 hypothetical protein [Sphaerochaetaceae bacterium]